MLEYTAISLVHAPFSQTTQIMGQREYVMIEFFLKIIEFTLRHPNLSFVVQRPFSQSRYEGFEHI
jgi:hypothetical protein